MKVVFSSIGRTVRRIVAGRTRGQLVVLGVLVLSWVALLVFLIDGDKPWEAKFRGIPAEDMRLEEFIPMGLWVGAAINLVVCTLLLATSRFWLRVRDLQPPAVSLSGLSASRRRYWLVAVLAAMAASALLAYPRLHLSFWGDEEHSIRQCIDGYYKYDAENETLYYRPHTIEENLWMYVGPNNHFLLTLTARACKKTWRFLFWQGGFYYSEMAMRLPAYIAGLLAILAVAWLLRSAGFALAGVVAAWLMALHPWHLKYVAEARGYAMVLLFGATAAIFLLQALRDPRWKWWGLFALSEFLMIYAYPGSLYLALSMNAAALAAIPLLHGWGAGALGQVTRWFVCNCMAAMVAIQLLAPTVPQMALWLQRDRAKAELGIAWIRDFWSFLSNGFAWHTWDASNPLCHALDQVRVPAPGVYYFLIAISLLFPVVGLVRFASRGWAHAAVAAALAAAAPLGFVLTQANDNILYVWYLIYALPAYVAFFALGCVEAGRFLLPPSLRRRVIPSLALPVVVLGLYAAFTQPQRHILRHYPVEPQRESVLSTRPSLDPYHPGAERILTVEFVFNTPSYDPRAIDVDDDQGPERLRALMDTARLERRPLFVNFGSERFARHVFPELMAIIEDPEEFELIRRFHGLEPQNTRVVYRYRHGG